MWNLKNKTNEQTQQNKNRVIDIENETGGCQIGMGWWKRKLRQLILFFNLILLLVQ